MNGDTYTTLGANFPTQVNVSKYICEWYNLHMKKLITIYLTLVFFLLGLVTGVVSFLFFGAQANRIFGLPESETALGIYILTLTPVVFIPVISYVLKRWRRLSNLYYFVFLIAFSLAALIDSNCIGSGKGLGCDGGSPSMASLYFYFLFIFLPASLLYFLLHTVNKLRSGR